MISAIPDFRQGTDWLHNLLVALSVLVVIGLTASSGMAQTSCCPMLDSSLPCHGDAMDTCAAACSFCQAQTPAQIGATLAPVQLALEPARQPSAPLHQLLVPPATPPPRG